MQYILILSYIYFDQYTVCQNNTGASKGKFTLPELTYDYEALDPHIDTQTMQLHHDMHHQAYITNLNNEIQKTGAFADKDLNYIVANASKANATVKNNAGGHYNHSLFWLMLSPDSNYNDCSQELKTLIDKIFDSFDNMQTQFNEAAKKVFGSGWAWLCYNTQTKKLEIAMSINQDNPCMTKSNLVTILGIDVWEHAYYLKYKNKRVDYIAAFWNIVDWQNVSKFYDAYAKNGKMIEVNDDGTVNAIQ